MLWQRHMEDGGEIDLRTIAGLPGQLLFAEEQSSSRLSGLPCTIARVTRNEITLDIPASRALPQAESAVILEAATKTALLQCFTTVKTGPIGTTLVLRTPARPHIVQRRRYPRISLFVGATLRTADRLVEPVPAQLINLSVDGAACVVAEPLAPGTEAVLNLAALGLQPPEVCATVMRCTPSPSHLWVLGLQLRSLEAEQEEFLGQYIASVQ